MSFTRMSVSLKIEKEDGEFYTYMNHLRENKNLSDMVVNLLKAHYENPEIQKLFASYISEVDPRAAVYEQLEKVNMAHNETLMATSILRDHLEVVEDLYAPEGYAIDPTNSPVMERRMDNLEKKYEESNEQLTKLFNSGLIEKLTSLMGQNEGTTTKLTEVVTKLDPTGERAGTSYNPTPVYEQPSQEPLKLAQPFPVTEQPVPLYEQPVQPLPTHPVPVPIYEPPVPVQPVYEQPVPVQPVYEQPVPVPPAFEQPVPVQPPAFEIAPKPTIASTPLFFDEEEEQETETKPKRPPSFAKALKSTKKN